MALYDNGDPEELLLFVRNFNMTLKASGKISFNTKLQCLRTLLHVYSLRKFNILCVQVGGITMSNLNQIILGLGTYFNPVNALTKQKCEMHCGMKNPG